MTVRYKARVALAVPFVCAVLFINCGKGTGLIANSDAKSSSGWSIKVLAASQPATINIKARSPLGGTEPQKATSPGANESWVQLTVEMTPPATKTPLSARQINLAHGAGSYPAVAMAGVPEEGDPAFVYFKESSGLAQINEQGQLLWAILNNKTTGDPEIIFQKDGGEQVILLFAVPASAKSLSLKIS